MVKDNLDKQLRENWDFLEKNLIQSGNILGPQTKPFDVIITSMMEREGDKKQIEDAKDIFYKLTQNIDKYIPTTIYSQPAYDISELMGEEFYILFYGVGMQVGILPINNKQVKILRFGNDICKSTDKKYLLDFFMRFHMALIHEFVHLNDYKRVKEIKFSDPKDIVAYYNNDLEFNAYYLQFAHYMYTAMHVNPEILASREQFMERFWKHMDDMQPKMKSYLTKETIFRWNKRIYQLYDELKKAFDERK
jgi:hypothetical protein